MKFTVERKIFDKFPEVKLGVVVGLGAKNSDTEREIGFLLNQIQEKRSIEFKDVDLASHERIEPWREAYAKFGAKPSKYHSSIEALLRRVSKGENIRFINPLVDLYNFLSLKYLLPFGGEDLDMVKGDIRLAEAKGSESGRYIGSDLTDTCRPGEVAYLDDLGFICRRWNWREADRTKLTENTQNFVLVAEALPPVKTAELQEAANEFVSHAQKYLGGEYQVFILDRGNPQVEVEFAAGSRAKKERVRVKREEKVKREMVSASKIASPREYFGTAKEIVQVIKIVSEADGVLLETPEIEAHGDYSTNAALVRAKAEGKKPLDLANELKEKLAKSSKLSQLVSKIEVKEPGFINFWLKEGLLVDNLEKIKAQKGDPNLDLGKSRTVLVEYSSPNIAKSFSVGHLRSTIIGQAIFNLYQALGFKMLDDNHLGDWGTQFGMIIAMLKKKDLDPEKLSIDEFEKLYVEANNDEEMKEKGKAWFKKLEEKDLEAREIWEKVTKASLVEFDKIYKKLNVRIKNAYGESFYEDRMLEIIEEVRAKGLTRRSEGAEIVEFTDMPPTILLKADGGTTYFTRDLATVKFRKEKWDPDLVVYEVGSEQRLHFRQVFRVAELMGWAKKGILVHVAHGQFLFEGKRMSTRKGTTIKLTDLLEKAEAKAAEIITQSETSRGLTQKEVEKVAEVVGVGAVKYFDLSHHPESDIDFSWEQALSLEGNSAPYLQYTVARAASILGAGGEVGTLRVDAKTVNQEELLLMRRLAHYQEVIVDAAKNYSPNLLANYLFDLAQKFNTFYAKHRVLKSENESLRLLLTEAVFQVLKEGLAILGIETPEKM